MPSCVGLYDPVLVWMMVDEKQSWLIPTIAVIDGAVQRWCTCMAYCRASPRKHLSHFIKNPELKYYMRRFIHTAVHTHVQIFSIRSYAIDRRHLCAFAEKSAWTYVRKLVTHICQNIKNEGRGGGVTKAFEKRSLPRLWVDFPLYTWGSEHISESLGNNSARPFVSINYSHVYKLLELSSWPPRQNWKRLRSLYT